MSNEQDIDNERVIGFFKGPKEMVVNADCYIFDSSWCSDCLFRGFSVSSIYLYFILVKNVQIELCELE